ncbi:hypothetical protein CLOM_g14117 [Closterium sp. NIES-68]|nr:hypothetical protein CLOM_g14117 [Closterium sp. NIES-68]
MPGLARLPFFPAPAHGPRPPARAATFGHGTRGVSIVSSSSGGGGGHDGSSSGGSLFPGRFTQSAAPDAPLGTRATGLADVSSSLPWSVLRAAPSCRCTGCALTTAALLLVLFLFLAYRSTLIDPAQQRDPVDSFGSADSSGSVQASAAWTRLWSPGAPAAHAAPHAVAAGGGGGLRAWRGVGEAATGQVDLARGVVLLAVAGARTQWLMTDQVRRCRLFSSPSRPPGAHLKAALHRGREAGSNPPGRQAVATAAVACSCT